MQNNNQYTIQKLLKTYSIYHCDETLILLGQQYEKLDEFLEDMPADKHEDIKNELWAETCKVLSQYSLDDFTTLVNKGVVSTIGAITILDKYLDEKKEQ